jgi:hypothetical protein
MLHPLDYVLNLAALVAIFLFVSATLFLAFDLRRNFGTLPFFIVLATFPHLETILAISVYLEVIPFVRISPGTVILFTSSLCMAQFFYMYKEPRRYRRICLVLYLSNLISALLLAMVQLRAHLDVLRDHGLSANLQGRSAVIMTAVAAVGVSVVLVFPVTILLARWLWDHLANWVRWLVSLAIAGALGLLLVTAIVLEENAHLLLKSKSVSSDQRAAIAGKIVGYRAYNDVTIDAAPVIRALNVDEIRTRMGEALKSPEQTREFFNWAVYVVGVRAIDWSSGPPALRVMISGQLALMLDLALIPFFYELVTRRLFGRSSRYFWPICSTMIPVLIIDTVIFSGLAFWDSQNWPLMTLSACLGKIVFGLFYNAIISLYLARKGLVYESLFDPIIEIKVKDLMELYRFVFLAGAAQPSLDRLTRDPRTNLYSGQMLDRALPHLIKEAHREKKSLAMFWIDIDMPASGDAPPAPILELYVKRLREISKRYNGKEFVWRCGDDRFVLVVLGAPLDVIKRLGVSLVESPPLLDGEAESVESGQDVAARVGGVFAEAGKMVKPPELIRRSYKVLAGLHEGRSRADIQLLEAPDMTKSVSVVVPDELDFYSLPIAEADSSEPTSSPSEDAIVARYRGYVSEVREGIAYLDLEDELGHHIEIEWVARDLSKFGIDEGDPFELTTRDDGQDFRTEFRRAEPGPIPEDLRVEVAAFLQSVAPDDQHDDRSP